MTRAAAAMYLQAAAEALAHVLRDPPDAAARRWAEGMLAAVADKRDEMTKQSPVTNGESQCERRSR